MLIVVFIGYKPTTTIWEYDILIWFGVDWNHGFFFMTFHIHHINWEWNVIIPTDELSMIFQRGRLKPPTRIYIHWPPLTTIGVGIPPTRCLLNMSSYTCRMAIAESLGRDIHSCWIVCSALSNLLQFSNSPIFSLSVTHFECRKLGFWEIFHDFPMVDGTGFPDTPRKIFGAANELITWAAVSLSYKVHEHRAGFPMETCFRNAHFFRVIRKQGPHPMLIGGLEHLDDFSIFFRINWECHHPNWRFVIFFRGVGWPPPTRILLAIINHIITININHY